MGNDTALSTDDLPSDVYYFAQLTPTNHGGVVWVVCIISLTYALLCSGVRFVLRRGMYGFDDAALLVSTLACIVQHTFVIIALGNGLGHSSLVAQPKHEETLTNPQSTYTRLVIFFVVHYMAKVSLTLFTRRLFHGQERYNQLICDMLLVTNLVFGVASVLLLSLDCQSGWYFRTADLCPKLHARWIVIKIFDVTSELALILVPIILICRILLNPKHKAIIISTFAARLPVIAFTILHLHYLAITMIEGRDRGIAVVQPVVWLQVTLLWSMVTASLPSFRPLVSPFNTVMEDSSVRSESAYTGAVLLMGSDKDKTGKPPATLPVSGASRLSQLEPVASVASQRSQFKGYNETVIQGPRKKLFRLSKKEDDIELGTIQHITDFAITYEQATRPSRWSKIWRESGSTLVEDGPVSVGTVTRTEETPPSRRRSTYTFVDEADLDIEVQQSPNDIPPK
ncbi:hypothetical protein E4T48_02179 [Aureobasidium sp. EXF-10727]|nr:hypothetical protein E4T48_02179 [Aureobasidium sp. EXF-10727]